MTSNNQCTRVATSAMRTQRVSRRIWLAMVAIAVLGSATAFAQPYPNKPVRLIVAYSPGGATDVLARMLGQKLSEAMGQQFVVENRPGASGMIGAQVVARAAPDGYTLLVAGANEAALNVPLFKTMPYDPKTDLAPVTLVAVAPVVLVSGARSEFKTLEDVLKAGRTSNPPDFASVSIGSPNHIAGELLNSVAKTDLRHVPYPGAGPAMTAVVGGHVPLAFLSLASAVPQLKSGTLHPIAVTTAKRFPTQPDIPTIAERGFAGFNISQWYGVLAPAKTPPEIVNRLHVEIAKVLKDPEIRNKILELGADPVGNTPTEFGAFIDSEIEKYRTIAVKARIEPQ
jgi:tripartite-type tricarboxylate transporter receptor subunit TctC